MNIFLGHIWVHYLPGGDRTWLLLAVLAVLAVAGYCLLLSRWLQSRTDEARAGMAPGIGRSAVFHAQADPAAVELAHVHAGPPVGPVLLVLHGLGVTTVSLTGLTAELARTGRRTLAPDLLGHGGSRRTGTRFGLPEQVAALELLLSRHGLNRVELLGYSYGCAVATAFAERHPDAVDHVTFICPPAFEDAETARRVLGGRSWLARRTVAGAPIASLVCGAMCLLSGPLSRLAPRLVPDVPAPVARAGVAPSYPAYKDALTALFGDTLRRWLGDPAVLTTVVLADDDLTAPAALSRPLLAERVTVRQVAGNHLVPVTFPGRVAEHVPPPTTACGPGRPSSC